MTSNSLRMSDLIRCNLSILAVCLCVCVCVVGRGDKSVYGTFTSKENQGTTINTSVCQTVENVAWANASNVPVHEV